MASPREFYAPGMEQVDTVILGAGAAGLFCAGSILRQAGDRAGRVVVLDHARAPGEKIRISGGGRCNFTNLATGLDRFVSGNPRFAASALAGFSPADFVAMVDQAGIAWHEKTLGQLFCDGSARQIIDMLLHRMRGAELRLGTAVEKVEPPSEGSWSPARKGRWPRVAWWWPRAANRSPRWARRGSVTTSPPISVLRWSSPGPGSCR